MDREAPTIFLNKHQGDERAARFQNPQGAFEGLLRAKGFDGDVHCATARQPLDLRHHVTFFKVE
jgi:hypothetical protein